MSASVLGVDTNVLVRFFSRDDAGQAEQALRIITAPENQPVHVSLVALVELVWVLTKVKHWRSDEVFGACHSLLRSGDFVVEMAPLVEICLMEAENAGCDFADALIARMNERAGCRTTVTFDQRAARLDAMANVEDFL